jgi:hypothetical protein
VVRKVTANAAATQRAEAVRTVERCLPEPAYARIIIEEELANLAAGRQGETPVVARS